MCATYHMKTWRQTVHLRDETPEPSQEAYIHHPYRENQIHKQAWACLTTREKASDHNGQPEEARSLQNSVRSSMRKDTMHRWTLEFLTQRLPEQLQNPD